jgi:hypothetical protein
MRYEPNSARKEQQKPSACVVISNEQGTRVLPYTSRRVHDTFMNIRADNAARDLGYEVPKPRREIRSW